MSRFLPLKMAAVSLRRQQTASAQGAAAPGGSVKTGNTHFTIRSSVILHSSSTLAPSLQAAITAATASATAHESERAPHDNAVSMQLTVCDVCGGLVLGDHVALQHRKPTSGPSARSMQRRRRRHSRCSGPTPGRRSGSLRRTLWQRGVHGRLGSGKMQRSAGGACSPSHPPGTCPEGPPGWARRHAPCAAP